MRLLSFRISLLRSLAWSAGGITAILAIGWWFTSPGRTPANDAPREPETAVDQTSPSDSPSGQRVTLPPEKLSAAHLHSIEVHRQPLQPTRTVPGRIDYRHILRVDIKAPVDSVIEQVFVKPGDVVERGSRLALLDSPEIGLARADVERNQADVAIARQNRDWAASIEQNLDALLEFLDDGPQPQQAAT